MSRRKAVDTPQVQEITEPGGPRAWQITVQAIPASLNVKLRSHFGAAGREQKMWFWLLQGAVHTIPKASGVRRVHFVRYGHGLLDSDNLAAAFKGIRDLLRPDKTEHGVYGPKTKKAGRAWVKRQLGLGLILGDGPGEAFFTYDQERVGTKTAPWTRIMLQDVAENKS